MTRETAKHTVADLVAIMKAPTLETLEYGIPCPEFRVHPETRLGCIRLQPNQAAVAEGAP